jgi:hypothetical protein
LSLAAAQDFQRMQQDKDKAVRPTPFLIIVLVPVSHRVILIYQHDRDHYDDHHP